MAGQDPHTDRDDTGTVLSDEEKDELRALRELVYGRHSPAVDTAAAVRRIDELTKRRQQDETPDGAVAESNQPNAEPAAEGAQSAVPGAVSDGALRSDGTSPGARPPLRRRWVRPLGTAAVGVLVFAVGLVVGTAIPQPAVSTDLPEFARPQTEEDVVDLAAPGIDGASTRFIATMQGFDIYLGKNPESHAICVVLVRRSPADFSAGCGAEPIRGTVAVSVTPSFSVGIGDDQGVPGERITLSESVTAYVARG